MGTTRVLPRLLAALICLVLIGTLVVAEFYLLENYGHEAYAALRTAYQWLAATASWVWSQWYLRIPLQLLNYAIGLLFWVVFVFHPLYRWLRSKWQDARDSVTT